MEGLPVTGADLVPEGANHSIVVSTRVPYCGIAGEIAQAVWGARHGCITPVVIVVEEDADPCDLKQVFHAMITRCHPVKGINKVEHAQAWPLIPWLSAPKRMSFDETYSEEVKESVFAKWGKYGS
jgi:UbiD family decarboxylase